MSMQFLLQITQPGSSMLNLYTKKPPQHETRVTLRLGRRENQLPLDWVNAKISYTMQKSVTQKPSQCKNQLHNAKISYQNTESMQKLVTLRLSQCKNQLPLDWINAKISYP
jgi:hypothetical protein